MMSGNRVPVRSWSRDLLAASRAGGGPAFDALMRRHAGLVKRIVQPWVSRCPANVGEDDLIQEVWIQIWDALRVWDESRGVPISSFVRLRVRNFLLSFTHKLGRRVTHEWRYLGHQIVEERVIEVPTHYGESTASPEDHGTRYLSVTSAPDEVLFDFPREAARVIGQLPSKQARLIVGVLTGEPTEIVTERVYGHRLMRPRKAALRAIATAARIIESDRERTITDGADETP